MRALSLDAISIVTPNTRIVTPAIVARVLNAIKWRPKQAVPLISPRRRVRGPSSRVFLEVEATRGAIVRRLGLNGPGERCGKQERREARKEVRSLSARIENLLFYQSSSSLHPRRRRISRLVTLRKR